MSDYWSKRFASLEKESHKDALKTFHEIDKVYINAIDDIEKEISKWYMRYATENKITYAEAKRVLNTNELKAFRMSVQEYIKKGESGDKAFFKELEQASVKMHVTRLEAIKMQLQMRADAVSVTINDFITSMAIGNYTEHYYKTLFTIQKGCNVGFDVMRINDKKIDAVLKKPWAKDGKNFSARIWEDRKKLIETMNSTFTQGVITGKNPQKIIKEVVGRLGVSRNNVARLVLTENKMLQSKAQEQGFKELGVKQYKISATLDLKTSKICQDMDGKIFKMSEYEIGFTAPPFHPYCRTHTVPYIDEDVKQFFKFQRAGRDKDGGYITVPSDMTYPQWREKFIK